MKTDAVAAAATAVDDAPPRGAEASLAPVRSAVKLRVSLHCLECNLH